MPLTSRRLIIGLTLAVAFSFISTAYYENIKNQGSVENISTSTLSTRVSGSIQPSTDEKKSTKWENDQPHYKSATEASRELPFVLKSPEAAAAGELFGFYVTKSSKPDASPSAWIYFVAPGQKVNKLEGIDPRAGITIYACSEPVKPDFAAKVAEDNRAHEAGEKKSDKPHVLVDVNGHTGQAAEPGYNNLSADYQAPRAGFVSWWETGVSYTIYGTPGPAGTGLDTMLEIARSMK